MSVCSVSGNKIEITQNNSDTIFCAVVDASGKVDLTDYDANFAAKKFPVKDEDSLAINVDAYSVDASEGVALFQLAPNDTSLNTGDYQYQVTISNNGIVRTVVSDILTINKSVL